jgi:hypothetical protein
MAVLGLLVLQLLITQTALGQDGLCARVRIELEQRVTITRNAFRATFTMINDTDETLTNISVPLVIRDSEGMVANDRFFIEPPVLTTLTGVDGQGTLGPGETGSAVWIIIPLDDAAPAGPEIYGFGGSMSYLALSGQSGAEFTPEELEVLPNPNLRLKYFWERNAYSDDPFTPEVEPAVPFTIGMMMINDGFGVANNVRIATSQPEIVENERGLLIDFELIGTRVGEADLLSPSLNVALGDLDPGRISVATWYMITSLQGQFVNYEARFEHLDALGQPRVFDPRLSLIESVEIFECIRPVLALEDGDDAINDFMTNEVFYPSDPFEDNSDPELTDLPDTLHLSDGRVEPVTPVLDATATVLGEGMIRVDASMPSGWAYIKLPDPFGAAFRLARVTRDDGRELPLVTNAWLTDRTFRTGQSALRNARIHLFDRGGPGRYTLEFVPRDGEPGITAWRSVASHGSGLENVGVQLFPPGDPSEGRLGGIECLALDFNTPVDPATVVPETVEVSANGLDGAPIEIDLTGLEFTPGQTGTSAVLRFNSPLQAPGVYCITVTGVTDPFGQVLTQNRRLVVSVVPGDVTGDRRVNNTDVGAIASLAGLDAVSPGDRRHVRADVNRDGRVDDADIGAVLGLRGADARFVLAPCLAQGIDSGDDRNDRGGRVGLAERDEVPDASPGIGSGPIGAFADPGLVADLRRGVPPETLGLETVDTGFLGAGSRMPMDPRLIAARVPEGLGRPEVDAVLGAGGIDLDSLTVWPVAGWWVGRLDETTPRDEAAAALAAFGVFSSPVLLAEDGGLTIPTETVLLRSDATLAEIAELLGVQETQVGPGPRDGIWAVDAGLADGDEVMGLAGRIAQAGMFESIEPDMIVVAGLSIDPSTRPGHGTHGDFAAMLLPELTESPASIPAAMGDRLDWQAMLEVPLNDPAPLLVSRAAEARLLPSGVSVGVSEVRFGRLVRGPGGSLALVTRLSWVHRALAQANLAVTIAPTASGYPSVTLATPGSATADTIVGIASDRLLDRAGSIGVSADPIRSGLVVDTASDDSSAAIDAGVALGWLNRMGLAEGAVTSSLFSVGPVGAPMVLDAAGDRDGDGVQSVADLLAFVELFRAGDPRADMDANGVLDLDDLSLFGRAFNTRPGENR